jgi:Asp-tRNA(Asn)/Glu-tRNA(Gln) amidotransferase C subunit
MTLRLRADAVEPSLPVDDAVGPAPDRRDALFQVPQIIK